MDSKHFAAFRRRGEHDLHGQPAGIALSLLCMIITIITRMICFITIISTSAILKGKASMSLGFISLKVPVIENKMVKFLPCFLCNI